MSPLHHLDGCGAGVENVRTEANETYIWPKEAVMDTQVTYQREVTAVEAGEFIRSVYGWMGAGLTLTGVVSALTISSPAALQLIFGTKWVFYALLFGELGLVIWLSSAITRLSARAATGMFLFYAALNGVTFAVIFLAYTRTSIASTFFITAGTFGAMSLFGYVTKKDLSSWGSFLFMGLIGVIIASVVNIFLKNPMIYWVVTYCGVIVFVGLTAYDTQKIKAMAAQGFSDSDTERKGAIIGALKLYLDFINLFLMLLRIFGRRR
jgi:FtsH-binding integral membrane protein